MNHSPDRPDPPAAERGNAAEYLIASKQCEIAGLEQLLDTGRLVAAISDLVHALQHERGTSNLYLASGGRRPTAPVEACASESATAESRFRASLARLSADAAGSAAASRLYSRLAHAVHGLDGLASLRTAVRAHEASSDAVMDAYSSVVQALMAVAFEAADAAADPDIARLLVAMFHLMQGKEAAGQERAVGAAGFAHGGFDGERLERLRHLIDSQERCFDTFMHFTDADSLVLWRELGCEHGPPELERMRRIALTCASGARADADLGDAWFDAATWRIDALKQVEDRVEATLMSQCEHRLDEAREDLRSHRDRLATLASTPVQWSSLAVYINPAADTPVGDAPGRGFSTGIGSAQLGRSLIELVQSQSQRLQTMTEELDEARSALSERKSVDRAKALLMKHRGLSEDDAYRLLRRIAMSQSRKLVEVARDTIAMADVLKPAGPRAGDDRR